MGFQTLRSEPPIAWMSFCALEAGGIGARHCLWQRKPRKDKCEGFPSSTSAGMNIVKLVDHPIHTHEGCDPQTTAADSVHTSPELLARDAGSLSSEVRLCGGPRRRETTPHPLIQPGLEEHQYASIWTYRRARECSEYRTIFRYAHVNDQSRRP